MKPKHKFDALMNLTSKSKTPIQGGKTPTDAEPAPIRIP